MTTTPTTPTTPTIQTQSRTPTQELYIPYWTNMRQTRNDDVSPISSNMNVNMSMNMNMNMNMSMNMNMNMTTEGYRSMPLHSISTMAREPDSMMMMMPLSYDNNNDNEAGDEDLVIRSSSSSSSLMTKEEEGEESGNRAFGIGTGFSSISNPNYLFETQRYNNDNNTESV